uniref:Piwi domain-containing protein n=1 Tax=Steinernema glaseri TaxID=37863 RepID=A0A1I7YAB5_9BILA
MADENLRILTNVAPLFFRKIKLSDLDASEQISLAVGTRFFLIPTTFVAITLSIDNLEGLARSGSLLTFDNLVLLFEDRTSGKNTKGTEGTALNRTSDLYQLSKIKPGTVVDEAVHFVYNEFYLNSHVSLKRSAKTPRFTILKDESGFDMDTLENMSYALSVIRSPPWPRNAIEHHRRRPARLHPDHRTAVLRSLGPCGLPGERLIPCVGFLLMYFVTMWCFVE